MPTEDYRSSLRTSRIRNLVSVTGQSAKSEAGPSSNQINFLLGRLTYKRKNTNGIFVCKRNVKDFLKKINYVMKNYKLIQKKMLKNKLPKKNIFIGQLYNILR